MSEQRLQGQRLEVDELSLAAVRPESEAPLYVQIEADLRRLLRQGKLRSGTLLPTEHELAEAYGVGRQTVRMALSRLATDDLIERQAGRGTIVKAQTPRAEFYLDRSFTRQMAEMGVRAHSQVLAQAVRHAGPSLSPAFQQRLGEPYLQLTRLRLGDDEPLGLQTARVLLTLCPGLEELDFNERSLYRTLAERYRLAVNRFDHTIGATVADDLQAALLCVEPGSPLLLITTTAYLVDGQLIEETISHYRADRYEFRTSQRYQKRF